MRSRSRASSCGADGLPTTLASAGLFVAALLLFSLTSLAGGAAPDQVVLVAARAAQGLAGALMAASSLAIITASFPPGPKLHRAIGTWAAMNGLGGAAGVLLGGVITEALSWRWVLLINPPIGVAIAVVAFAVVADRRMTRDGSSFDLAGALTLTIGQMVLVYGVVEAGLAGGTPSPRLARSPRPGTAGWVCGDRGAICGRSADSAQGAEQAAEGVQRDRAAVQRGALSDVVRELAVHAAGAGTFTAARWTDVPADDADDHARRLSGGQACGPFRRAHGAGRGLIMLTTGLVLFTRIGSSGSAIIYVMIPGVLTAAGIAMSIVPSTIAATQSAGEGQAGLASGLVNTSRQIGGGLGLAVLITLATQRTTHLIGSGEQVAQALTAGFRLAYLIGAGLAAAAAVLTFAALPRLGREAGVIAGRFALAIGGVLALFLGLTVAFAGSHGAPLGAYTTDGAYAFVTEPTLHPPKIRTGARRAGRHEPRRATYSWRTSMT